MPRSRKRPRRGRGTTVVKAGEDDKLLRLFEEASEESSVPDENISDEECEESERSDDERRGLQDSNSEGSSGTDPASFHDPYSDVDGEYGSDCDYNPAEDEEMSSEDGSTIGESDDEAQNITQKHSQAVSKCAPAGGNLDNQQLIMPLIQAGPSTDSVSHTEQGTLPVIQPSSPEGRSPRLEQPALPVVQFDAPAGGISDHEQLIMSLIQAGLSTDSVSRTEQRILPVIQPNSPEVRSPCLEQPASPVMQIGAPAGGNSDHEQLIMPFTQAGPSTDSVSRTEQRTLPVIQPSSPEDRSPGLEQPVSPVIQSSAPAGSNLDHEQLLTPLTQPGLSTDSVSCHRGPTLPEIQPDSPASCVSRPESSAHSLTHSEQPIPAVNQPSSSAAVIQPTISLGRQRASNSNRRTRQATPTIVESWEETTADIPDFEFDVTNVGPSLPFDDMTTPINVLDALFTSDMIIDIVSCTNACGQALCNSSRPHTRGSRKRAFKPTDPTEMKKFLGLCLLQGNLNAPNMRKLFTSCDPLYFHPLFPFVMSGRRYEQILRCLRVSDLNSKGMDKIKLFVRKVISNFQNAYQPDKALSLDESLMAFRGRVSFRQYIKSKKARYGIKFYILTTDDGYVLNFIVYEGKNTTAEDNNDGPKIEKLVFKLLTPYLDKGHELYMDNYYNSHSLSSKLLERKTHTTGTLRKDRKDNCKELLKKSLKKGDYYWARKGKVYQSIWKDKRLVYMITTKHHPRLVVSRNRYGKIYQKPIEVDDYNRHMSGIDKSDQMLSYYSTPRKTIRWHKKVFFHLMDMFVWNAYYLYKKKVDRSATLLSFRESIIKSYLQLTEHTIQQINKHMCLKKNSSKRQHQSGNIQAPPRVPEANGHWPEPIPLAEGAKRSKAFLKCRVCRKKKILKCTSFRCKGCPEKPALCPGCFEEWHLNRQE